MNISVEIALAAVMRDSFLPRSVWKFFQVQA
jgi:hypothetical protein